MEELLQLKSVRCNSCNFLFKTKDTEKCEFCGSEDLSVISEGTARKLMREALSKSLKNERRF